MTPLMTFGQFNFPRVSSTLNFRGHQPRELGPIYAPDRQNHASDIMSPEDWTLTQRVSLFLEFSATMLDMATPETLMRDVLQGTDHSVA